MLIFDAKYPLFLAIYNIYWHPLSKYPGPTAWAAFRFFYVISLWRGKSIHDIHRIHVKYGDIVRVAPNELSFASGKGWEDIYGYRAGHPQFPKNPIWWGELPGRTESIVSASKPADHARMRKVLGHCFTAKALMAQEYVVQSYINRLIGKLHEMLRRDISQANIVDITDWYMFTTFDIIGDLGFGETFHCLDNGAYHPWVAGLFNYFKIGTLFASLRFYPLVDTLVARCMPSSVAKSAEDNYQWAINKVHRRLNLETERDDFISQIIKYGESDMSIPEIENNSNVLIVAGSETVGTALTGTTNYLIKTPSVLQKLTNEVRSAFSKHEDMTFSALTKLPYLNAVIEEGLRLGPPVPSGLARVVPAGGGTVCGEWLPQGVSIFNFVFSSIG